MTGVEETAQWLRAHEALAEDLTWICFPAFACVTPAPRDQKFPLASMGTAYMCCADMHAGKTLIHIKEKKNVNAVSTPR